MLKVIRYILAAICLAASVGCVALWWHSTANLHELTISDTRNVNYVYLHIFSGDCVAADSTLDPFMLTPGHWVTYRVTPLGKEEIELWQSHKDQESYFGGRFGAKLFHFPLWFPALVFALAAVAAIRIGRQFTLRSALVGISVVAALLGVVVALRHVTKGAG